MRDYGFSTKVAGLGGRFGRLAAAGALAAALGFFWLATAAEAALDKEAQFVLNTFSFLIWGALVMWMCAGFTMLESGSVRTKNVSMICLKNMGLYAIAGIMYFFIGYNLMYVDVGSVIGSFTPLYGPTAERDRLDGRRRQDEGGGRRKRSSSRPTTRPCRTGSSRWCSWPPPPPSFPALWPSG